MNTHEPRQLCHRIGVSFLLAIFLLVSASMLFGAEPPHSVVASLKLHVMGMEHRTNGLSASRLYVGANTNALFLTSNQIRSSADGNAMGMHLLFTFEEKDPAKVKELGDLSAVTQLTLYSSALDGKRIVSYGLGFATLNGTRYVYLRQTNNNGLVTLFRVP